MKNILRKAKRVWVLSYVGDTINNLGVFESFQKALEHLNTTNLAKEVKFVLEDFAFDDYLGYFYSEDREVEIEELVINEPKRLYWI